MPDLSSAVSTSRILTEILPHLPARTYLVGGCVRDLMLGMEPHDFDLVTFSPAFDLALTIGDILGGTAFLLDKERGVARVALKGGEYTVDISPPRGPDIEADLRERDITINAMAWEPRQRTFIDCVQGRGDLQARRIRLIGEKNLLDDPLRGLRCIRFAVQLNYAVDELTMKLIRRYAHTIAGTAPERIKHEFLKALGCAHGAAFFLFLAEAGYDRVLFGGAPDEDAPSSALETVRQADLLLDDLENVLPGIGDHFSQELEHNLTRASAFRLCAYFARSGVGRPSLPGKRLALSARACRIMAETIAGSGAVHSLAQQSSIRGSDRYRLLADHDGCIPEMLLLALATSERRGPGGTDPVGTVCESLWAFHGETFRPMKDAPLLSGREVCSALGIPPGPQVGEMLRAMEEARADGLLRTPRDAMAYLLQQAVQRRKT